MKPQKVTIRRAADMRYVGQEHAVTVDLPLAVFTKRDRDAIKRLFDAMHELRYGTSAPQERAEIVSLRSDRHRRHAQAPAGEDCAQDNASRRRQRSPASGRCSSERAASSRRPTYRRTALLAGNRIKGPALIEEHASTTVLMPGDACEVDAYGNLVIAVGGAR